MDDLALDLIRRLSALLSAESERDRLRHQMNDIILWYRTLTANVISDRLAFERLERLIARYKPDGNYTD